MCIGSAGQFSIEQGAREQGARDKVQGERGGVDRAASEECGVPSVEYRVWRTESGVRDQHPTPHSAHSILHTRYSTLGTPHSVLRTLYSALCTQYSALSTPHSTLLAIPLIWRSTVRRPGPAAALRRVRPTRQAVQTRHRPDNADVSCL